MSRGEKSLLCDPGSELRLGGRENRKAQDDKWDGEKKKKKKGGNFFLIPGSLEKCMVCS